MKIAMNQQRKEFQAIMVTAERRPNRKLEGSK
jgi:hypothetical protein